MEVVIFIERYTTLSVSGVDPEIDSSKADRVGPSSEVAMIRFAKFVKSNVSPCPKRRCFEIRCFRIRSPLWRAS